jgi:hypothetical protein
MAFLLIAHPRVRPRGTASTYLIAYLLFVVACSAAFVALGTGDGHAFPLLGALAFIFTAFQRRGFFPGGTSVEDASTQRAALGAVIRVVLALVFIAHRHREPKVPGQLRPPLTAGRHVSQAVQVYRHVDTGAGEGPYSLHPLVFF